MKSDKKYYYLDFECTSFADYVYGYQRFLSDNDFQRSLYW